MQLLSGMVTLDKPLYLCVPQFSALSKEVFVLSTSKDDCEDEVGKYDDSALGGPGF